MNIVCFKIFINITTNNCIYFFLIYALQTTETANTAGRQVLVNGQQTSVLLQAMKASMDSNQPVSTVQQTAQNNSEEQNNKQFVVTPDYIQQSMFVYQPSVIVYNPNCAYPLQNDYIN